jgi:hypothetical protein
VKVPVEVSPEVLARRNGTCDECNAAIRKGEPIVEVAATGKRVHPECIPVEEAKW